MRHVLLLLLLVTAAAAEKPSRSWLTETPDPRPPPSKENGLTMTTLGGERGFASYDVVAYSPDGRHIASWASDRKTIEIAPTVLSFRTRKLKFHQAELTSLRFSADGESLISGSANGMVGVWALDDGDRLRASTRPVRAPVTDVDLSVDDRFAVLYAETGEVVFNEIGGEHRIAVPPGLTYRCVRFTPDGKTLALGAEQGVMLLGKETVFLGKRPVHGIAFSPDGHWMATGSPKGPVEVFERRRGAYVRAGLIPGGAVTGPTTLAFSRDGDLLAAVSPDTRKVVVYRTVDLSRAASYNTLLGAPKALVFMPDASSVGYAGGVVSGIGGNYISSPTYSREMERNR